MPYFSVCILVGHAIIYACIQASFGVCVAYCYAGREDTLLFQRSRLRLTCIFWLGCIVYGLWVDAFKKQEHLLKKVQCILFCRARWAELFVICNNVLSFCNNIWFSSMLG